MLDLVDVECRDLVAQRISELQDGVRAAAEYGEESVVTRNGDVVDVQVSVSTLIFDDLQREARAYDHMGHGALDIALWDLAGKRYGVSVARLLGVAKSSCAGLGYCPLVRRRCSITWTPSTGAARVLRRGGMRTSSRQRFAAGLCCCAVRSARTMPARAG